MNSPTGSSFDDGINDAPGEGPTFSEYVASLNNNTDEVLDQLLNGLQAEMQQNQKEDLAEDIVDPLTVLAEDTVCLLLKDMMRYSTVLHVQGPYDDEANTNPPLFPDSKRNLGIVVLLLVCFMIRFRLSNETMQHLLILL